MTREDLLRAHILSRYHTIQNFITSFGLQRTTVYGILQRGVLNARLENVYQICECLGISLDALISNRITLLQTLPSLSVQDANALRKYHSLSASDKEIVDFLLDRQERDRDARPG